MTTALKTAPAHSDAPTVATHGNVAATDRLPLAVLAAEVHGRMMCVVIDSFFDESLAPGLVSVRIPADHPDWDQLRNAPVLGISVLNPLQTLAAGNFATASGTATATAASGATGLTTASGSAGAERAAGAHRSRGVPRGLRADHDGSGRLENAEVHLSTRLYQEFDSGEYSVALLHVTAREVGPLAASESVPRATGAPRAA